MTDTYPHRIETGLSRMAEALRARMLRWHAFRKLVFELRTKSDDELRDAGFDPVSRRLMARRAIYGN